MNLMISHLKGSLLEVGIGDVVLDVAGVGYRVFVSPGSISLLPGETLELWVHMAVRENSMDLYGFGSKNELNFFELLIGVPGIGPKSALAIISLATVDVLEKSIASGDTTYLTKVSGVGKKSAEKIVLELKDKMVHDKGAGKGLEEDSDVIDALQSLGYSLNESRSALKELDEGLTGTNEKIRAALKLLGNGKK